MKPVLRPFRPVKPGEILQDELEVRNWTQADLAEVLGRPVQAINEIISGKKAITPDTALAFSQALGTSPEYWLNLESSYRLDVLHQRQNSLDDISRRSRLYTVAPVKELVKRKWIEVPDPSNLDQLEEEVCRFLGISSADENPQLPFAARTAYNDDIPNPSQIAWAYRVRHVASGLQTEPFSAHGFEEEVKQLSRLSSSDEETRRLPRILADLGVRFVIVGHLPHTRIDGAALWLDDQSPVIAVSLRYDRVDGFWFTVMHELAHILRSDAEKDAWLLDNALVGKDAEPVQNKSDREVRADAMASEWLLSRQKTEDLRPANASLLFSKDHSRFCSRSWCASRYYCRSAPAPGGSPLDSSP